MLPAGYADAVADALRALGVDNLVLGIPSMSFPGGEGEDAGRGTAASAAGRRFLSFVRELGFTGVQFGPEGQTTADNASPYDGTVFARNILSIGLGTVSSDLGYALLEDGDLSRALAPVVNGDRQRIHHREALARQHVALAAAYARFTRAREHGESFARALAERLAAFRATHVAWLERAELFEVLGAHHGDMRWGAWTREDDRSLWSPPRGGEEAARSRREQLAKQHAEAIERHAFMQMLAHDQHQVVRGVARSLSLKLIGDLQVGYSPQDAWGYRSLMFPGYAMGAPPSRTNPAGQPWGYPVLDPRQYVDRQAADGRGAVARFLAARMDKMFQEFDAVRIDHPHGLVCPWVYRDGTGDPQVEVARGARLFSSPDLPDHPELAEFAIVRPEQLQRASARYADDWESGLEPEQVDRFAVLFDEVVAAARRAGRSPSDLVCEVLSTLPRPLGRILQRHGLGRFRVTHKADVNNPADVYRSENADERDWVMFGNHDTPSMWRMLETWRRKGVLQRQVEYLATRLGGGDPAVRDPLAQALASSHGVMAAAQVANLLTCPARNVMVFFMDAFGMDGVYNTPGTVSEDNWVIRLPPDAAADYAGRVARGEALNIPRALALALRAPGRHDPAHRDLLRKLDRLAGELAHT